MKQMIDPTLVAALLAASIPGLAECASEQLSGLSAADAQPAVDEPAQA